MAVAPASSSSTSTPAKHDVFLSFRGEDTRARFTSHLHAKLSQKNVETFIDNRLSKGDEISPALIEAIRRSMISIIIFSENYALSSWCLEEVVCILKCKKEHRQTIVPVFYDIEPSLVRRQLDRGQPAFQKHMKEKAAGKVEEWKNALIEAASISGWDSQAYKGTEAEFVEDIAKDILAKLNEMYSSSDEFKGLVGINENIEEMKQLLRIDDSTTVRMIGIWGMGGLGKTTLARVLFKQLSSEFEGCCFLANVREESGKCDGPESLEKKLFSELLEENDLKTVTHFNREKLHYKKVLIVLDDVDNAEQLEVLAAGHYRFGLGSRVILTTRDAQVLRDRVDEIYELKKLGSYDSLRLFIAHAFKRNYTPTAEDVTLSKRVVNYADGNPLALKVLGPLFRSKRKGTWETELEKLKKFPNKRVHNILKVSFDGLDETEKAIFLDIVCFFRIGLATCRKNVERILSVHRSYVNIGIDCLIEKSLVAVKDHNNLAVHDLLREMGWEIERQQCERTRLWDEEHLYHVFRNNTGTPNVVEGISCFIGWERRDWSPTMFQGMHRLWLLHIPNIFSDFPQGLQYLPDSLKCLIINHCSWKSLPSHFMAPNLVELRMPRSSLVQLWSGVPNLGNLKYVDLSHSIYLTEISALSQAPNLVSVDLSFCASLHQVPPLKFRIGNKLTSLDQSDNNCYCNECRTLGHLKLDYCIFLKVVEKISGNLKELHLRNSISIEELSSSICSLYDLVYLNLNECRRLKSLPSDIQMLKSLKRLNLSGCSSFDTLPVLPKSLIELDLTGTVIEEVPSSSIEHLFGLEKLTLHGCKRLKSLPSDMQMLKSLTHLDLKGCSSFDKLPVLPKLLIELDLTGTSIEEVPSLSIEHLFDLKKLTLYGCKSLKSLPTSICKLKSLKELQMKNCINLEIFPVMLEPMENLQTLDYGQTGIRVLTSLANLPILASLDLSSCNLSEIPNDVGCLSSIKRPSLFSTLVEELPFSICSLYDLEYLNLCNCRRLKSLPSDMQMLKSLRRLDLKGCSSFDKLPVLPRSLIELDLTGTLIKEVPSSSIEHLFGLKKLTLYGCKRLKSLPSDMQMLKSLTRLDLKGCFSFDKLPVLPRSLIELDLTGTLIKEVPSSSIEHLFGLKKLTLHGCKRLKSLPSDMQMLKSLTRLDLKGCFSFDKLPVLPRSLIELDLTETSIEEVPSSSIEFLFGRKKLTLNGCKRLKSLPSDMQILKSLRRLDLKGCSSFDKLPVLPEFLIELDLTETSIEEVPSSSIEHLFGLEKLTLHGCKRLKSLPSDMQMLKSLTHLDLKGCSSFDKLPVLPKLLIELDLTGTSIEEVPSSSIEHLFDLKKLTLYGCENLKSLPTGICKLKSLEELQMKNCINLEIFPVMLEPMEHLQTLDYGHTGIRVLTSLANLPILTSLDLSSCNLSEIPDDVGCLSSIKRLSLCSTLVEELPFSICTLYDLKYLNLCNCRHLKSLPSDMQMLKSLTHLDLKGCSSFDKLPVLPRSLIELDLARTAIEEVPSSSIEHLFGLKKLTLHGCKWLKSLPSDMQMLKSLTQLDLKGCSSFDKLPVLPRSLIKLDLIGTSIEEVPSSSIEHLFCLMELMLYGCESLTSLPSDMQMLIFLTCLDLKGCSSFDKLPVLPEFLIELDLTETSIEEVPSSSIEHLFGLQKLKLHGCKRLKSLPSDMQMLKSLTHLDLKGCSSFDKLPVLPKLLIELDLTGTSIEEVPSSSIEHLFDLKKLTLYGCESLKSLPTGICKLKSLKELDLMHCNNLEIFPAIKNLSKLIVLLISSCKMLKSLPELPLSLELLDASGCTSLGKIANSRDALLQGLRSGNHVITSMEFFYIDCLNLDQNMCNNILSEFQLRTLDMSTKSVQPHVGLNISDPSVSICCPGNKIPMWFTHQSESASINIRLSPDWKNTNFLGFALCAVVANGEMPLDLWCEANFKTNNGESDECFWDLNHNDRTAYLDFNSSNLFMWYKPEYYHNCLDIADVSFCFSSGDIENKVRACGVRPLYLQDAKELGITNELGKSNATSTGAVTCTSVEPPLKRIKTSTSDSK